MFTENVSQFFDVAGGFAVDATLNAVAVSAIFDTESLFELDGVVTQQPSALLPTSSAASTAPGQAFVANAVTYTVRRVLREPPDGVLTRLVLTR
jgi:hypothetical protein